MRNGAVRLLLAWVLLTVVNSVLGLAVASQIVNRVNRLFYRLASVFRGL